MLLGVKGNCYVAEVLHVKTRRKCPTAQGKIPWRVSEREAEHYTAPKRTWFCPEMYMFPLSFTSSCSQFAVGMSALAISQSVQNCSLVTYNTDTHKHVTYYVIQFSRAVYILQHQTWALNVPKTSHMMQCDTVIIRDTSKMPRSSSIAHTRCPSVELLLTC